MKIWAVVIGKKGNNKRYVHQRSIPGLSVYDTRKEARQKRQNLIVRGCEHVYVVPFIESKKMTSNNGIIPMPKKFFNKFFNACTESCDMVAGPCTCGAWHSIDEWPDEVQDYVRKEQEDDS